MTKTKKKTSFGVATLAVLALPLSFPAYAASDFGLSCSNARVLISSDLPWLAADCLRVDHTYVSTSLLLTGIENLDGALTRTSTSLLKLSTFQKSCSTLRIEGSSLRAICTRNDGSALDSSLILPIGNQDGFLTY